MANKFSTRDIGFAANRAAFVLVSHLPKAVLENNEGIQEALDDLLTASAVLRSCKEEHLTVASMRDEFSSDPVQADLEQLIAGASPAQ